MASKLQEYRRMSEEAQRQLTGSLERWQSFLKTASRLYKYPYHEQVMIHAQRPDATACAEYDVWNNTMGRFVRRGSKGIALIDTRGDRDRLCYVWIAFPMYWQIPFSSRTGTGASAMPTRIGPRASRLFPMLMPGAETATAILS